MDISAAVQDGVATFALKGRLDTVASPGLEKELRAALEDGRRIVVDFSGVEYVASAGLRVLLVIHKEAVKRSLAMRLRAVTPNVMSVFNMTGFSSILAFED